MLRRPTSALVRRHAKHLQRATASIVQQSWLQPQSRSFHASTISKQKMSPTSVDEPVDPASILRPEKSSRSQLPLDQELPGLPVLKPADQLDAPQTQVTTLPSGLRVISQETYGQAATLGVFVGAGTIFENDENVGVSHMLQHLGFKSSTSRSHAEFVREAEDIGAVTSATADREQIIYTIDLLRDNAERGLALLADTIVNPALDVEEVEFVKQIMKIETEDMLQNSPALVQDYIHAAAYGPTSSLGRPVQCPLDKVDNLTVDKVLKFRQERFTPDNLVLAGAGIEHESLVSYAKKYFADLPTTSSTKVNHPVVYKGGVEMLPRTDTEFSYAAVAFPTKGGWHDDDLVPVCVLHTLLGGGDSFSAGGPGKGMYSRLYTSVLNRFYWVESAFALSAIHDDVGLLGIYGAGLPSHTSNLVALLCNQLLDVAKRPVQPLELERAKNQLKSSVLMNLESRMVLYEDIGRQLLTYGERESPESVCAKIDKVTQEDLMRVMRQAMEHEPSVVYCGDEKLFPKYEHVVAGIKEGLEH